MAMGAIDKGHTYAGLMGLELHSDSIDLGSGIVLTKIYAHLMASFVMAFKPAEPGKIHPAPWKGTSGGYAFDVTTQLFIPESLRYRSEDRFELARIIVFLLRLVVNP